MYVVLTSKPGEYRTEPGVGVETVAAYEYHFQGRFKAVFAIARIQEGSRVRIVEETPNGTINDIPTRQMEKFATAEQAYEELAGLTQFGSIQAELRQCQAVGHQAGDQTPAQQQS
ncbi:ferredoxin [Alcaligenes ammonioxydans]|uniref:Ferredoxin n=1 Tax=Alcaligenes ammonioxydans TaxID=2582914 RepID=A0ABX8SWQ3_9BURK|nr:hypothetical protein [Alcaligenes ammonioxydans]MCH1879798.1 ferredoxin [Alcaligenes ammonioxydans]QBH19402.1 ferredoxin [Alcaligenes faecalis]QXX80461.1 ferredoxin [Alcaligenes ammonioxydans]WGQ35440.1 ferredoxin [Alcaligenes faecalis]